MATQGVTAVRKRRTLVEWLKGYTGQKYSAVPGDTCRSADTFHNYPCCEYGYIQLPAA